MLLLNKTKIYARNHSMQINRFPFETVDAIRLKSSYKSEYIRETFNTIMKKTVRSSLWTTAESEPDRLHHFDEFHLIYIASRHPRQFVSLNSLLGQSID